MLGSTIVLGHWKVVRGGGVVGHGCASVGTTTLFLLSIAQMDWHLGANWDTISANMEDKDKVT
jgi:hypothetical protein